MQEGKATLKVHNEKIVSKQLEVFYNPRMQHNRDITLGVLKSRGKENMVVGLPLAGSGVRAVRLLLELPTSAIKEININDMDEKAVANIKEHLKLNDLDKDKRITIEQKDANYFLLGHEGFDYIDIDPFGSPNPFLDSACRKLSRNALLAVTATDTATLAGRYPQTCQRRYWSTSLKCPLQHEIGLRILIRRVQLVAAEQERFLEPLFSYHQEHYYRVFFSNNKSKTQAEKNFSNLNTFIHYNKETGDYYVDQQQKAKKGFETAGPLYGGPLHNTSFLKRLHTQIDVEQYINDNEHVGFFDTHTIASLHKTNITPTEEVIAALQKKKYVAARSSITPTGIVTNAPFSVVKKICTMKK